jgi:hypothetical protein
VGWSWRRIKLEVIFVEDRDDEVAHAGGQMQKKGDETCRKIRPTLIREKD